MKKLCLLLALLATSIAAPRPGGSQIVCQYIAFSEGTIEGVYYGGAGDAVSCTNMSQVLSAVVISINML
jgi:hypothetical protein